MKNEKKLGVFGHTSAGWNFESCVFVGMNSLLWWGGNVRGTIFLLGVHEGRIDENVKRR